MRIAFATAAGGEQDERGTTGYGTITKCDVTLENERHQSSSQSHSHRLTEATEQDLKLVYAAEFAESGWRGRFEV